MELQRNENTALCLVWILCLAFSYASCTTGQAPFTPIPQTGSIEVYFSPNGGCTEAVVREIEAAKEEILVQAYSFTSKPIAQALIEAKKRGVNAEAILDKSQESEHYTAATFLANSGIPTYIDQQHAIAHNKILLVDRSTVITGSFNFTKAAEEHNAENLLVIKGHQDLADKYFSNYRKHLAHSEKYPARY